jgi:phosphoketolase
MMPDSHPHGMDNMSFEALFTRNAPVIFAFHNNRWLIHSMVHGRSNEGRFHSARLHGSGHDDNIFRHGSSQSDESFSAGR